MYAHSPLNFGRNFVTFPESSQADAAEEFWEANNEQRKQRWAAKRAAKAHAAARQIEEKLSLVSFNVLRAFNLQ